jgi:hypothetical protein
MPYLSAAGTRQNGTFSTKARAVRTGAGRRLECALLFGASALAIAI